MGCRGVTGGGERRVPGTHMESVTPPATLKGRNQCTFVLWGGWGFIYLRSHHIFIVSKLQVVCVYSEKEGSVYN